MRPKKFIDKLPILAGGRAGTKWETPSFRVKGGGGSGVTKERVIRFYKLQFFVESFRVDVLRTIYAGTKREICSFSCFSTEGGTYKCWEGFLELMRRNVGWIYVTLGGGGVPKP